MVTLLYATTVVDLSEWQKVGKHFLLLELYITKKECFLEK